MRGELGSGELAVFGKERTCRVDLIPKGEADSMLWMNSIMSLFEEQFQLRWEA